MKNKESKKVTHRGKTYEKLSPKLKFLSLIISLCALTVSVRSCIISNESLEISNRPYLALKPVKFSDNDSYLQIKPDYDKKIVSITIIYEITNYGKSPAVNMMCPKAADVYIIQKDNPKLQTIKMAIEYIPCAVRSIAPGASSSIPLELTADLKEVNTMKKDIEWLNSGEGFVETELPIHYSSLDSSKKYRTTVSYRLGKHKFVEGQSSIE